MNWKHLRPWPWLDTRARFVAGTPAGGSLLDIGSSDGRTLRHLAELRPDLRLFATDIEGAPEAYPPGTQFHRGDIQRDRLPWPDGSIDSITCMHLVEHLTDLSHLMEEASRLLKPGGRVYFETPHPKSVAYTSAPSQVAARCVVNFYDDGTHVRPITVGWLARCIERVDLQPQASGTSRNWPLALAYPAFCFLPARPRKYVAYVHWIGWQVYLIAAKSASVRSKRGQ